MSLKPLSFVPIASSHHSHPPTLLERILALDRSEELSKRYTPFVLARHPAPKAGDGENCAYVVVGHAEKAFIDSTLLHCKNEFGDPIFLRDVLPNSLGAMTEVIRLHKPKRSTTGRDGDGFNHEETFTELTASLEHLTNHLLSSGVISHKHSDMYPIFPLVKVSNANNKGRSENEEKVVLAHINRSAAPFLGIDSVGVHLHCYVCEHGKANEDCHVGKSIVKGVWLAKRAPTKSHHPNFWDPTVAGGQPVNLSLVDNIAKEAQEEAGIPAKWIYESSHALNASGTIFSDHTDDPLTITTAKPDGTCMKRSLYYSCDLRVPHTWVPTAVDGEVSEFKLYSMEELEEELRFGNSVRPAMRAVLLDFMIRHSTLTGDEDVSKLRAAMRRQRLCLW